MPYLEYYPPHQGPLRRIPLINVPFRIGRSAATQFVISSYQVSKEHAEIFRVGEQFRIRDLGSTNGTFVNGYRITEAPLMDDDILHVGHEEFRFIAAVEAEEESPLTQVLEGKAPLSIARGTQYLQEMIRQQWVRILFQPIVNMQTRDEFGFEALGRGMHNELSTSPSDLLQLADRCGMAVSLSHLFRQVAVTESAKLPCDTYLFLNLHPAEIGRETFIDSIREVHASTPANRQLVLEIHENVVCDMATLSYIRREITALGMKVAYDDFGAGQSRFFELAELPPDFIKLDMRLVKNIDRAEPRRKMLTALARASVDLGIQIIAEGVETPEEAEVCQELGCHLGQGFFFGLPKAATQLKRKEEKTRDVNVAELRSRLRAQAAK